MKSAVSYEYFEQAIKVIQSSTVIPFASVHGPEISCGSDGEPDRAAPLGFAFFSNNYTITRESDGTIDLANSTNGNRQFAFTAPYNCIIENVYAEAGPYSTFNIPSNITVFPFIKLYKASQGSNLFKPLDSTKTENTTGFSGSISGGTLTSAQTLNIGEVITAGDRILIAGHMESSGTGSLSQNTCMYFTGGISLLRTLT